MPEPKLLLVDDEEGILRTLGAVLQMKGFEVQTCATVRAALEAINSSTFDVLITDLNIGQPADGFTLVSAMRRLHPETVTIIITGYPDFQTALESLRNQVDDYIVKPTNPEDLVSRIERKLKSRPTAPRPMPTKQVATIVQEAKEQIIDRWLATVCRDPEISSMPLSNTDRTDHLPDVLQDLCAMLESQGFTSSQRLDAAHKHGRIRREQGYSIPMILEETRVLRQEIFEAIHADLLSVDFSRLLPDLNSVSDTLQVQLRASIESYLAEPEVTGVA